MHGAGHLQKHTRPKKNIEYNAHGGPTTCRQDFIHYRLRGPDVPGIFTPPYARTEPVRNASVSLVKSQSFIPGTGKIATSLPNMAVMASTQETLTLRTQPTGPTSAALKTDARSRCR